MRIGILTLPLHTNYGGILQAYALQTVLEQMGHEVFLLCRPFGCKPPYWAFVYIKRFFLKLLGRHVGPVRVENVMEERLKCVGKEVVPFVERYIHRYPVKGTLNHLKEGDFDSYVVGSDQIWRPSYSKSHYPYNEPFLDFTKKWHNVKRIAYAASFGMSTWSFSKKDTTKCKELIKQFDAVSVREESGVVLCEKYLHYKKATRVIDPTMLLDASEYSKLIPRGYEKKGNVMCYLLDTNEELENFIVTLCQRENWTFYHANSQVHNSQIPLSERIQPPVESWLAGFRDADFIVTDSFHACVFSILYQKPFLVYCNPERGTARFQSLLSLFNLENRIITNFDDKENFKWNEIDYRHVFEILKIERERSLNFLSLLDTKDCR